MAKRYKDSKDGFKQLKLTSFGLKITKSLNEGDEASKENVKSWPRVRANRLSSKVKEITAVINLIESDYSDESDNEDTVAVEKTAKVISVKKPTPLKTSSEKLEPRCLQRGRLEYIPESLVAPESVEKVASPIKRQIAVRKVLFANESENISNNYVKEVEDGCSPIKKSRPSEDVNTISKPEDKSQSSCKKTESAVNKSSISQIESNTNKTERDINKAESTPDKAAANIVKSPTSKAASPSKRTDSPRRILSLRKDIFESTEVNKEKTSCEDAINLNNNSEEIISINSSEETVIDKNSEETLNTQVSDLITDELSESRQNSLDIIQSQIAELSDVNLEDYGITESEFAEETVLENCGQSFEDCDITEETTVEPSAEHLEDCNTSQTPVQNLEDCVAENEVNEETTVGEDGGFTETVEENAIGTIFEGSTITSTQPVKENIIGRIRLRNMNEIIDTSKFSNEPNALQSDVCKIDLENLSEDAGGMSELRTIMRHVAASPNLYSILYEQEKVILKSFFALKQDYQYVCFKLFLRQPKWYNMVKFLKDINVEMEEGEIREMFTLLHEQLFVETDYSKDPHIDLLNNLMREDVKDIFNSFKLKSKTMTKESMVSAIIKHCGSQSTLSDKSSADVLLCKICDKMGPCVKLLHSFHHIIFRIHLLYSFTSPALFKPFDLYSFMRAIKNGTAILPTYTTDFMPVFRSKEEFFRFSTASEYYNEYMNAKEKDDKELMLKIISMVWKDFKDVLKSKFDDASIKPNFLKKFTAGRVHVKTLSLACDDFRTNLNIADWLEFLIRQDQYNLGRRGDWYSRLAIMYNSHLKYDCDLVAQKVIEALVDPNISIIDKYKLSERASTIVKRKTNKPSEEFLEILKELIIPPPDQIPFPVSAVNAKPAHTTKPGKKLYIVRNFDGSHDIIDVETVALNHYATKGYPRGIHIEGGLVITLFSLFFWDLIFDFYVPGTFVSEIQDVPLDLYSKDFYTNRKSGVDKRMIGIETNWSMEELVGFAREILTSNCDKFTQLLSQQILQDPDIIFQAIPCIGRMVLAKIFRRLVKDFRAYHSGMPDLFVWNPDSKKCKFVEVKSENDTLSMTQKLWLDYLRSAGADIELCHVNSIGSKIKKGRR